MIYRSKFFFTSALVSDEWSTSRPGRFIPGTHWIGGWVGPRTGLDDVENKQNLTLSGLDFRPLGRSARSSRYSGCATPDPPMQLVHLQTYCGDERTRSRDFDVRINVCMAACLEGWMMYTTLLPERLNGLYSYSAFRSIYVGSPENKFRWSTEKKKQEFISKPFILPFDVHTLYYFST
jgi:hypothetical protein